MAVLTSVLLAALTAASPLQLRLVPGAHYSNVFSVCIAFDLDGQKDETVYRNSGSATYIVDSIDGTTANLTVHARYDGRPVYDGKQIFDLVTRNTVENGKQAIDTDSSGLLYNPFMWGEPPAALAIGSSWNVTIPQIWELGPAGTVKVSVLALDQRANSVTLQRDGSGTGASLDDKPFVFTYDGDKVKGTVAPVGPATWHGMSTFQDGIVLSDSIVVTRNVLVKLANGKQVRAHERLYTLVVASPVDTNP